MSAGLAAYLDGLYAGVPATHCAEVRSRRPSGGMRQEFVPLSDRRRLEETIIARGHETDTFLGVVARVREAGGRDAVGAGPCFFIDCDTAEASAAVARFKAPPSLVVRTSGHGRHVYYVLGEPLAGRWLELGNRRLAHELGADSRACDRARVFRPPQTFSFKGDAPFPVELEHVDFNAIYAPREVVGALPDPPAPEKPERRARTVELNPGDPIRAVPLPAAFEVLAGEGVPRSGMVRCPSADHQDKTPSCHVEAEVFYCHGCGRGGSIVDLGALLWEIEPRGAGYHEIRRRLEAELVPALRRAAA